MFVKLTEVRVKRLKMQAGSAGALVLSAFFSLLHDLTMLLQQIRTTHLFIYSFNKDKASNE